VTEPQDESGRVGLVGKTLGRYRISAELGRGGMATVYRAFDPQLARDVAIKVMHGAFTGRGDIERRFRREAQAVAALKHEAIVDVFDFAPGGDGEPAYIVSELVEGPTLRQLIDRAGGRVLPEVAVVIGARVAAALGAAHARGIVHRDVKPENMFVTNAGGERDFVKVLDFGLARPAVAAGDARLTREGGWLGTPGYMAPEQVFGRDSGPSADLYALGCVAYWLLSGEKPFEADDAGELMRQHVQVAAAPLGERAKQPIPPALEAVVMACLAKEPASRPRDADELSERLARAVDGEPWSSAEALAWWAGKPSGP
jgi:serine/threonine-protein kinase